MKNLLTDFWVFLVFLLYLIIKFIYYYRHIFLIILSILGFCILFYILYTTIRKIHTYYKGKRLSKRVDELLKERDRKNEIWEKYHVMV